MLKLPRSEYYDLTRDTNWKFKYVTDEEVFPLAAAGSSEGMKAEDWWEWDEPYKVTYREYVHTQANKDTGVHSVRNAISRSNLFENLDPGWKSALTAHYAVNGVGEYSASIGEARMSRFGRAAAWRNVAMLGTLDETRHSQLQTLFPHALLDQHPQFDWAHKAMHTEDWGMIAARGLLDDMFLANDAISTAIQLTYTFETGFSNLQFLGMAADAMHLGDVEFGALISSIQTDEARHAQQGEPTLKLMIKHGRKDEVQQLVDVMFWRSWKIFALLTGMSVDYYTPLENRSMSFKEFMEEWIIKQFMDTFRDLGLDLPWYWDTFMDELDWYHHGLHIGVWHWRSTVWFNPDGAVSPAERAWLESKYPGWEESFGFYWDTFTENIRNGEPEKTLPLTLPILCHLCQLPVVTNNSASNGGREGGVIGPRVVDLDGKRHHFCSEPCQWIFEQNPERYARQTDLVSRFIGGQIQPPTLEGAIAYMGLTPETSGRDATNYAWAAKSEANGHVNGHGGHQPADTVTAGAAG
ncbi:MAG: methane/phenol/toluene hydroxylase [Conexibacter sp.]|nr:methane/phenol/toluene hydroxylase [Conexibacter sp.]